MKWFAEGRWFGPNGETGQWQRLGGPYKTQERAKAQCKTELKFSGNKRVEFRTVVDDARGTVHQISVPPHAWRLRWVNAVL